MSPEECDYLDGPAFVAWLDDHAPREFRKVWPSLARGSRRWRRDGHVSVYTADYWLVQMGLHLSEIPDDLYLQRARGYLRRPPLTPLTQIRGQLQLVLEDAA